MLLNFKPNIIVLAVVLLAAVLSGCQSATSSTVAATTTSTTAVSSTTTTTNASQEAITIGNNFFNPSTLTISPGTTVVWTNQGVTHTVTSTSGPTSFNSGNMSSGGTYSFTFSQTGAYNYECTIHAGMTGQIVVE